MYDIKIIRFKDLKKIIGVSISTIYRWEQAGNFPKRLQLGKNSVGWRLDEVEEWISKASNNEAEMIDKEAFESLPKDVQKHLKYLQSIPGALTRFFMLVKELKEGKVKIVGSQIIEID